MADLEPYIGVCERTRGIPKDLVEAGKAIAVLGLLLVYYAEAEENLVRLVEV